MVCAVDFETYYEKDTPCSITHAGTHKYLEHPDFDAYLVSIVGDNGLEWCGHPDDAPWDEIDGWVWLSHNQAFDGLVYEHLGYKARPGQWHCTANMCAYVNLPRALKFAAKSAFGAEVSKDVRDAMSGKRWADMGAEFQREVIEYALEDSRWCLKLYQEYGDRWPEFERRVSQETIRMCWRGVPVDYQGLRRGIMDVRDIREEATNALPWVYEGSPDKVLSPKALARACAEKGVTPPKSLARDNEATDKWIADHPDIPWVSGMQEIRRANTLEKKLVAMRNRTNDKFWMPYDLKYYGGHLGRDSGAGGVNMQNLAKEEMMGVDMRGLIKAPKGMALAVVDLSAIEPRALAWLVEDKSFLEALALYPDIYEAYARKQGLFTGDGVLAKDNPKLRSSIKVQVLGLNYGMGIIRFAQENGYSQREARMIWNQYHRSNPLIFNFGKTLERDLATAARLGRERHVLELPGGSRITYVRPRKHGVLSAEIMLDGKLSRREFYAGKLVENVTQHFARQIFMHGVMLMVDRGILPLMRVHDEVVVLDTEDRIGDTFKAVVECFSTTPDWAGGLPLAADGKIVRQYQKI